MKLTSLIVAALPALVSVCALAQVYPSKSVHIVVPFAAGGAVDTSLRTIGQKLSEVWKQTVVFDNRGGAGGIIGVDAVAKAVPDGYTLLGHSNALAISPALYRKLPYDAIKDFVPIVQLTSTYFVLVVNPAKLQVSSVNELIQQAKATPGAIAYGSTGVGAAAHLVTEQFKNLAGVDMLHIPYKGDAQSMPALLSGEVQVGFMPTSAVLKQVK